MGEVVWFSTLLILMISCQGIGAFITKGQTVLSGGDDQKNDQNITPVMSQQLLNSFHLLMVKVLNDMENRMEDKLFQLQNVVNDKISLLDSKTKSRFSQFQNGLNGKIDTLDTKTNSQLSQLQNNLNSKIDTLDTKTNSQLSQLQNNLNSKIDTLDTKTNSQLTQFQYGLHGKIDMLTKNFHDQFDALENKMEDRFKSTDEKLIYLQVHLNTRKDSLDRKVDDKLEQLHGNLTNKSDTCQKKADIKLSTLQSYVDTRIGTLENYINDELDTLGVRLEDKLDNNSLQLNDKMSQKLANYGTDSKTDIINSLESLLQKSQEEQKTTLENFSEDLDKNMNKTLHFLARIESNFEACKKTDDLFDYKNQTREILDALTSINSTKCQHLEELPIRPNATNCYRGMANDTTKQYQRLELMRDNTLDRHILCDTQTDGGGWIVIQRRTEGDVDFYRNWTEYKNGFGTPPGDFWIGNEAIYDLTNEDDYELRIDFNIYGLRDLFAVYSSFRLESESDNYRLRLGSHSGTLREFSNQYGLSYSNGVQFSTYDRVNDTYPSRTCSEVYLGGWWYDGCLMSYLNGRWVGLDRNLWWNNKYFQYYARRTEMKIRLV